MPGRNTLISVGFVAAAGLALLLVRAHRSGVDQPAAPAGSPGGRPAGSAGPGGGGGGSAGRPGRVVPPPRVGSGAIRPADVSGARAGGATSAELASSFDAEPDDPAWATAIEPDVRARAAAAVADAGARFGEVRCRSQRCRITADGDEDAVGRAIARLEEPGGLAGLADALVVAATEPTADGGLHLVVYAYFERDPAAP